MSKAATFASGTSESGKVMSKRGSRSRRRRRKSAPEDPLFRVRYRQALPKDREMLLRKTARDLMEPGKGILAADDTVMAVDERLKNIHLEPSEENRRRYHDLLLPSDSPTVTQFLSGAVIREGLLYPAARDGKKLKQLLQGSPIKLGLRLDKGVVRMVGTDREWTSQGLDQLEAACTRGAEKGAVFALWRCVYRISDFTPSTLALFENSNTLARFASICQTVGIVPILSVETLNDGSHDIDYVRRVLTDILSWLVKALASHHIFLEGMLVRISAASPGKNYKETWDFPAVAMATLQAINESLPPAIGGVLLAREPSLEQSVKILDQLNKCPVKKPLPMSFCFSHVIHDDVITLWAGQNRMAEKARSEYTKRLKLCSLATMGQLPEQCFGITISNVSVY